MTKRKRGGNKEKSSDDSGGRSSHRNRNRSPTGNYTRKSDNRSSGNYRHPSGGRHSNNGYNFSEDAFHWFPPPTVSPRFIEEYPVDPHVPNHESPFRDQPFRSSYQKCGFRGCRYEGSEFMLKEHINMHHSGFYDSGKPDELDEKWRDIVRSAPMENACNPSNEQLESSMHQSSSSHTQFRENEPRAVPPGNCTFNEAVKKIIEDPIEEPAKGKKSKKKAEETKTTKKKSETTSKKNEETPTKAKRKAEPEPEIEPESSDEPSSKKHRKGNTKEPESESDGLVMVFVDDNAISEEKEAILKCHLSKKLDDAIEAGLSPIFEGIMLIDGQLHITCANSDTLKWLTKVCKKLPELWDGAKIQLLSKADVKLTKISVFIPGPVEDAANVFKRIRGQNKMISTKRWKIYSQVEDQQKGQIFEILIDKTTKEQLEAVNFRLYYQLGQLVFRISKNQPQKGDEKHLKVRTDLFV